MLCVSDGGNIRTRQRGPRMLATRTERAGTHLRITPIIPARASVCLALIDNRNARIVPTPNVCGADATSTQHHTHNGMGNNMARNWNEAGIVWHTDSVSKKNAAGQLVEIAGAQLPEIVDLEKFDTALKAEGGSAIAVFNASNSPTVKAQACKRDNPNESGETLRERVWRTLCGIRNARKGGAVVVRTLPDGTTFTGTTRMEYVAATMAALVDLGVPAEVARAKAQVAATAAFGEE